MFARICVDFSNNMGNPRQKDHREQYLLAKVDIDTSLIEKFLNRLNKRTKLKFVVLTIDNEKAQKMLNDSVKNKKLREQFVKITEDNFDDEINFLCADKLAEIKQKRFEQNYSF